MTERAIAYQNSVNFTTDREVADRVFSLCQDGRIDEADSLLVEDAGSPDLLFANGYVQYWRVSTGRPGSFEAAKDTLTHAVRLFSERGDRERELLCNVYLGLCYSRQGQPAEARVLIGEAFYAEEPLTVYLARLSAAVVELEEKNWQAAKDHLSVAQPTVELWSLSLQGRFYMHRALAHELAKETDGALTDYEQALVYFEQAGNWEFAARIYNNLANTYLRFDTRTAHLNIDPAITIQRRLKNYPELANCLDTRALIFLEEGKLKDAEKAINEAIELLETDHQIRLPGFLITRGRIYAEEGLTGNAKVDFLRAIEIAELNNNTGTVVRGAVKALCTAAERNFHRMAASPSRADFRSKENAEESELFRRALAQCDGSVADAAQLLGMKRTTLITRINNHHPELVSVTKPKRRRSILRK